jgi:hypothetical protein
MREAIAAHETHDGCLAPPDDTCPDVSEARQALREEVPVCGAVFGTCTVADAGVHSHKGVIPRSAPLPWVALGSWTAVSPDAFSTSISWSRERWFRISGIVSMQRLLIVGVSEVESVAVWAWVQLGDHPRRWAARFWSLPTTRLIISTASVAKAARKRLSVL